MWLYSYDIITGQCLGLNVLLIVWLLYTYNGMMIEPKYIAVCHRI